MGLGTPGTVLFGVAQQGQQPAHVTKRGCVRLLDGIKGAAYRLLGSATFVVAAVPSVQAADSIREMLIDVPFERRRRSSWFRRETRNASLRLGIASLHGIG